MKSPAVQTFFVISAISLFTLLSSSAEEPIIDVYVSTGDNHFLGSSLPIDSPASINATFDLFRDVQHARRIYWRGHQASCWMETMQARPENPRSYSFWTWLNQLYEEVKPDQLAVQAARQRGMEIWGMGTLWDWGSPADTPVFTDYPFCYESKLKLEHPEWAPMGKHGVRHQGGPIELAYPEARKALVDLVVRQAVNAGYDGLALLTYVENYSLRFEEEFGYSDPVVEDFKRQYKLDLRTEPFRRGASREDWLRLRGSYVTAYLRELKAALEPHGIELGMVIDSNDPSQPMSWNVPELTRTAGAQFMDINTWVREGLVDELLIYGNNSGQSQMKALEDLQFLAKGTGTSVSVITSGPFRPGWEKYQEAGMPTILAVSDDIQHLSRGFIPEQSADALQSDDLSKRMRALQQVIDGDWETKLEDLSPLADSENLIERRLAIQALGGSKDPSAVPVIEKALSDPENGVRCVAALALAKNHGSGSAQALLSAVEKHGNHMLRECAIIALRRLQPFPSWEIERAALESENGNVREAAMRSLVTTARTSMLPTFQKGLKDPDRFPRFAAAEALGNLRKSPEAVDTLIDALTHEDVAVVNRAATSLGKIAARNETELQSLRPKILDALLTAFRRHTDANRSDHDWGWRPVGNAILEFGDEGAGALREIRDQQNDTRLAELAWRVVDLPQKTGTFSDVTKEENEAAMARRPGNGPDVSAAPDLHVDPNAGNDSNNGRSAPVKTIARAIKLAQPGDTIHLTPGTYYESADFTNKHGLPGMPITLDGNGAVLDGSEPVTSADWIEISPDLYQRKNIYKTTDDAIVSRWFLLWDGNMQRMNRCSKGPSEPLKKPQDLQPGEWTFVREDGDAFYLKLQPGQKLDEANIRYPKRSNAIVQSITGSWLTVKNVTGTHVYNDGFNVHGAQRNLVYENIAAIECGDDGFSAHEDADCRINGFVSIRNATGFCDTGTSQTHYKNVYIKECTGFDIYFIGLKHSIENAIIESSAARAFWLDGNLLKDGQRCQLKMRNVVIRRVGDGPQELRVGKGGVLFAENCTFDSINVMLTPKGSVEFQKCVFQKGVFHPEVQTYRNTIWRGDGNYYNFKSLRVIHQSYTPATFPEFQKATGAEANSHWDASIKVPEGVGVDEASLEHLKPKERQ
ncbi:MAG: HEAT repeat domain-containing protein [Verrucomicrobiales bacterium]|nr:HEAT repeat domain-containing protein [Verrucomicrobiales bacterium]